MVTLRVIYKNMHVIRAAFSKIIFEIFQSQTHALPVPIENVACLASGCDAMFTRCEALRVQRSKGLRHDAKSLSIIDLISSYYDGWVAYLSCVAVSGVFTRERALHAVSEISRKWHG